MCGINGIIGGNIDREGIIRAMNVATKHRGPDGVGVWKDDHVALGHNLLAITETVEHARQPVVSSDGNFVMVYNGEVYNYENLRKELEEERVRFHTNGDTEVIFRGLMTHGPGFFAKLDGMFAIAFYDKRRGKLFLARDPSGMKPLYRAELGKNVAFSSELRGLFAAGVPRRLDLESAKAFFVFGYTPGKDTLISGITKILPGSFEEIDVRTGTSRREWFGWEDRAENEPEYSPNSLRERIGTSVNAHTMGLRPFGLFLSGGMDSTVILHELAVHSKEKVKTYTTRFDTKDPRANEDADLAERLTRDYDIDHHEILVTEKDFVAHYDDAILAMEEPRYNPSVPAYWLLAKRAASDITIVLNGSGGDELFLGYPRYVDAANIARKYRRFPRALLDLYFGLHAYLGGYTKGPVALRPSRLLDRWYYVNKLMPAASGILAFMERDDPMRILRGVSEGGIPPIESPLSDETNALAELDRWFWLANEEYLRTDKIIMHFGMEGRFPFLARDLVRLANGIPSEEKLKNGKKSLLRGAYRGRLPEYIINKRKSGWNAPVAEWMSGEFGNMVREVLSPEYHEPTADLFDLRELRRRELDGKESFAKDDLRRFLPVIQFRVWARSLGVTIHETDRSMNTP